ncbi:outer-membrane lipoprotein carrier protein LolA [Candidatus Pelagibacter sp.]|jgi:outer membrane lipoprotein-sorting protein|nr:outer-membrane lipoprotein carrier protein LolA [Candidatus Pelagibacter sp.]
MMKKIVIIFFVFLFNTAALGTIKDNIIISLSNTQNLNFNFEQNINGKIETGNCTIEYPKKIFCRYKLANQKILVSNGKSLVIKTKSKSYYRYPITRTPLNFILDKSFLIDEIKDLNERVIDNKFINFMILKDGNEINIFFDKNNYNFIGWQILDIYQNLNITYLSSLKKNQILKKNLFKLPSTD